MFLFYFERYKRDMKKLMLIMLVRVKHLDLPFGHWFRHFTMPAVDVGKFLVGAAVQPLVINTGKISPC